MTTEKAQRLFLWMGMVGALAMAVASVSFFAGAQLDAELYSAAGLRERLEHHSLGAIDSMVMTVAMAVPLLLAGVGGVMMSFSALKRSTRAILWGAVLVWVLTIAAFVASLRIVAAGVARTGTGALWPPELMQSLQWMAWIPVGSTLLLWGAFTLWVATGTSPLPKTELKFTPFVLMLPFLFVGLLSEALQLSFAPAVYAAAPWAGFLCFVVLRLRGVAQ